MHNSSIHTNISTIIHHGLHTSVLIISAVSSFQLCKSNHTWKRTTESKDNYIFKISPLGNLMSAIPQCMETFSSSSIILQKTMPDEHGKLENHEFLCLYHITSCQFYFRKDGKNLCNYGYNQFDASFSPDTMSKYPKFQGLSFSKLLYPVGGGRLRPVSRYCISDFDCGLISRNRPVALKKQPGHSTTYSKQHTPLRNIWSTLLPFCLSRVFFVNSYLSSPLFWFISLNWVTAELKIAYQRYF